MSDFKKAYNVNDWAKAARNCQRVHNDLRHWFRDLDFPLGFGALSSKEENQEHDSAEPDIFAKFAGVTIAGIEVTGSEKIACPNEIWIGRHKIEYAKVNLLSVAYVLFYTDKIVFTSSDVVRYLASGTKTIQIRGNPEQYYTIESKYAWPYEHLEQWLGKKRRQHLRRLGYVRR